MEDWHTAKAEMTAERISQLEKWEKCRDDAFNQVSSDQAEYDKQLLTLSSGFLAVSLAFIKDIVHLNEAHWLPVLYLSFMLFAACIVLVLFSYQFSIAANLKVKDHWDKWIAGHVNPMFPNQHAVLVNWLNRLSGIVFVLGVLSIVTFVITNLRNEAKVSQNQGNGGYAQDGAPVNVPYQGDLVKKGQHVKTPPPPPPNNAPAAVPKRP